MSYIGNSPSQTAFLTDQFSGTGSQTAFTMSVAPANTASCIVAVSGVLQDPSTYSVVGTTLNFTVAPPAGSGNISVRYLGIPASGVTTTAYRTATEFTATSGQTTFTPPSYTVGYLDVYRNGALLGSADYTATNGTTVVLAVGAVAGDLIETISFYVSSVLNAIPNTTGSISSSNLPASLTINTPTINTPTITTPSISSPTFTNYINLPTWTTGTRPGSPVTGTQGYNTTTGQLEIYNTINGWTNAGTAGNGYTASYLIVAGGGGGGGSDSTAAAGGGGGAGGYLTGTTTLTSGIVYTVTVGSGGAGGTSSSVKGTTGNNSSFTGLTTALGGGGGGSAGGSVATGAGLTGGSGGGNGYSGNNANTGAAGTSGQGFAGGAASTSTGATTGSGGGGGASAVGADGGSSSGGNGGAGSSNSITGSAITYAGGGGGGAYTSGTKGTGGAGGGGNAGATGSNGTAGTANLGGGGGGGSANNAGAVSGGAGGSGVVIISVPTTNYTGTTTGSPTVTTSGSNTIIKFTASGSYTA